MRQSAKGEEDGAHSGACDPFWGVGKWSWRVIQTVRCWGGPRFSSFSRGADTNFAIGFYGLAEGGLASIHCGPPLSVERHVGLSERRWHQGTSVQVPKCPG